MRTWSRGRALLTPVPGGWRPVSNVAHGVRLAGYATTSPRRRQRTRRGMDGTGRGRDGARKAQPRGPARPAVTRNTMKPAPISSTTAATVAAAANRASGDHSDYSRRLPRRPAWGAAVARLCATGNGGTWSAVTPTADRRRAFLSAKTSAPTCEHPTNSPSPDGYGPHGRNRHLLRPRNEGCSRGGDRDQLTPRFRDERRARTDPAGTRRRRNALSPAATAGRLRPR